VTTSGRLSEWLPVTLGALLLAGAVTVLGPREFRADQHAYNLLVLKTLDPGLLQRDLLYRHDPSLFHVPWFITLQAALARRLGGDAEAALLWLAWPIGVLYMVGHYALFRVVSGSPWAAALATLGALTIRNALGGEFWGFDGPKSAAARTILAGLAPLFLLLFLGWRRRRSFPAYYLVLGLAFNLHPVSAYHLAQVGTGVALFGAGTLPYALPFFAARDSVADPARCRWPARP
jgi:hypothetical protein